MTVTATTTRFSFAGNGNQGPHTIGFIILDATHIQVYFDKATSGAGTPITGGGYTAGTSDYLVKDVHYTVQNAGTSSNATITYIATGFTVDSTVTYPTSSDNIIVTRNVPLTQTSDYTNNSTIDAETLENSYDKLTQITQQLDDNKDYSFKFATSLAGTTAFDTTVATASTLNVNKANRLNKAIKFNASGNIGVSTYDPDEQVTLAKAEVTTATTQANNAATSATLAGNYANKIDGVVTGSDYSSKAWAVGGTGVTDTASAGAAKEWATETSSSVDTSEYSAKEYAVGTQRRGQANGGSSKDWATYTSGTVDNADYSAKYWALNAEQSKLAAKASAAAVANVYDNFADTFLGSMADGATASSGSANGTWSINSSSITLASTSGTIEVGQEVTGTGIPTDANVLSVDGSTIVISENMAAAGSSVALTFTGQGVYGAFNSSKDGPATDNDGDALATGTLYFNTTDNEMRVYDGANWIAASASGGTSFLIYKYVATGGQTTFTGTDANGASLSYTTNNLLVFLNGVKLDASDFTATSGTSVVLGSGATESDELVIVAFKSFTTADMVPASTGGTFSGNVAVNGDLTVDTNTLKVDSSTNRVGIGTSSPLDSVHIKKANISATSTQLTLHNNNVGSGSAGIAFSLIDDSESTSHVPKGAILFERIATKGRGAFKFMSDNVDDTNPFSAGDEVMRIHNNGDVELKTTNADLILPSGGGISFQNHSVSSATGASSTTSDNVLDDYEEGTFTPTCYLSYNPSSRTLTDNGSGNGKYIKVGKIVYCEFEVGYTGISGSSGSYNVGVQGLPFATDTTVNTTGGVARTSSTGNMFILESINNAKVNVIRRYDNNGPSTSSQTFDCSLTYITT